MDDLILRKLEGYNRPLKTKLLAKRLNMDRQELATKLKELEQKNEVTYISIKGNKDCKIFGWIKSYCNLN